MSVQSRAEQRDEKKRGLDADRKRGEERRIEKEGLQCFSLKSTHIISPSELPSTYVQIALHQLALPPPCLYLFTLSPSLCHPLASFPSRRTSPTLVVSPLMFLPFCFAPSSTGYAVVIVRACLCDDTERKLCGAEPTPTEGSHDRVFVFMPLWFLLYLYTMNIPSFYVFI